MSNASAKRHTEERLHFLDPDIETSSAAYAGRFSGAVGNYFLSVQESIVRKLLSHSNGTPLAILDVGGGHAQLTKLFLELGHEVWVHGSDPSCESRIRQIPGDQSRLHFFVSPLQKLKPPRETFDVVTAFRLLPHVVDWQDFLRQLSHFTTGQLIFDFAPKESFNFLTPMLFQIKKRIEGNTREYFLHRTSAIQSTLTSLGFFETTFQPQFFFPMGVHRKLQSVSLSTRLESLAESLALTKHFGSPTIVSASRRAI